jgi:hypothetical protein
LFGLYVADSVAMPVHWMYNLEFLKRDYGEIKGYTAPLDQFEGSYMDFSSTESEDKEIVGTVILHGKR